MGTDMKRIVLVDVLQTAIGEARTQRAGLPFDSPERHFYLGIEAAAASVLHPERQDARPTDWLDRERPAFRNGYLSMSARIAGVLSSSAIPARLPLPSPT